MLQFRARAGEGQQNQFGGSSRILWAVLRFELTEANQSIVWPPRGVRQLEQVKRLVAGNHYLSRGSGSC